jgi:type I restriction enzyme S subunit
MKRYEKYKDSGVEWLGEIPEHWTFERMKHIGQVTFSSVDRHELVTEKSVKVCHYPVAYKNESVDTNTEFPMGTCSESEYANFQLLKGDIILTKDSETANDIGVPCFVKETIENCVCGYHLAQLRVIETKHFNGEYLFRYFQTKNVSSYFETSCNGVTRFGLGKPIIENMLLLKPTLHEQQIIARYLDYTTSTIDFLIKEKSALITKLQEKRKALINEVVTKGLDPNVPMRDSGIEWLGMIPEHWGISKIKFLADLKSGTNLTSEVIEPAGDFPVYGGNGLRGFYGSYTDEGHYILIGRQGALCGNINYAKGQFWATEHAVVCYPKLDFKTIWLGELLRAMNLNQYSIASAQPGLAVERIKNLAIPVPSTEEQAGIVDFIESRTTKIEQTISDIQIQIQKLKEYKTAVISEVVTGKVDVREWKPKNN